LMAAENPNFVKLAYLEARARDPVLAGLRTAGRGGKAPGVLCKRRGTPASPGVCLRLSARHVKGG
jgi:hypothetical protein